MYLRSTMASAPPMFVLGWGNHNEQQSSRNISENCIHECVDNYEVSLIEEMNI